jgi:hypothetical protein
MAYDALAALLAGSVTDAGRIVAGFEAKQTSPRGIGMDWRGGMPSHDIVRAEYLLRDSYDDLPFTNEIRRAIGAELALVQLLGQKPNIPRLLKVTGGAFSCAPLE